MTKYSPFTLCFLACGIWTGAVHAQFRAPITAEKRDFTPRAYEYSPPQPLALPSQENLQTITIKNRSFEIKRLSSQLKNQDESKAFAAYEKGDEALFFSGSGGAGRKSKERLVIEDCTFVVDFQEGDFSTWDARRCAVFVTGYNEVIIRNCAFFVKGVPGEPDRRTMASIGIYDTLKVQIEDCYFEGLTNWMRGHVTIFDSGATTLRRLEVSGTKLGDQFWCGGGLWIANGVGEGKLGSAQELENKIYPSGPLLIEDCYVHDQQGNENTDGIYIQSIHPYLVRNCRVENWGKDGLMDLGFRDSARGTFEGKPLVNHGAIGVVENCDFSEGYIKCSVGLGGGLIFRNNTLKNAWLYPYVFDGGSWYVLNNRWSDQRSVLLSGRDAQTDGWSAKEGMFVNGSKMFLYGNTIEGAGSKPLFVSSKAKPSRLEGAVISDYNVFNLQKLPAIWADDQGSGTKYANLEEWRRIGNDTHSVLGKGDATPLARGANFDLKLPGGVAMDWNARAGVLQPRIGASASVTQKVQSIKAAFVAQYADQHRTVEVETLVVTSKTLASKTEKRTWASGGAYLSLSPEKIGDEISFALPMNAPRRFHVSTKLALTARSGTYQLLVNGEAVGVPQNFGAREKLHLHGAANLKAGDNIITYRLMGATADTAGTEAHIDALLLEESTLAEKRNADLQEVAEIKAAQKQQAAERAARIVPFEFAGLTLAGKIKGREGIYGEKEKYRLWQPRGAGDSIAFMVPVPVAGEYSVTVRNAAQADKGQLELLIDGQKIGEAVNLGGVMKFGRTSLTTGTHNFIFQLVAPQTPVKVRFMRLELSPTS